MKIKVEKKEARIMIRLSVGMAKAVEDYVAGQGITVSDYIRELIILHLGARDGYEHFRIAMH